MARFQDRRVILVSICMIKAQANKLINRTQHCLRKQKIFRSEDLPLCSDFVILNAGAMLIFSVSFQFCLMPPEGGEIQAHGDEATPLPLRIPGICRSWFNHGIPESVARVARRLTFKSVLSGYATGN